MKWIDYKIERYRQLRWLYNTERNWINRNEEK